MLPTLSSHHRYCSPLGLRLPRMADSILVMEVGCTHPPLAMEADRRDTRSSPASFGRDRRCEPKTERIRPSAGGWAPLGGGQTPAPATRERRRRCRARIRAEGRPCTDDCPPLLHVGVCRNSGEGLRVLWNRLLAGKKIINRWS
jgi:hypothetical protein